MQSHRNKHLIVIAGPTGVGKTEISIRLAKYFNTEIISADARQFYRELNIGTAKPTTEQLSSVPHHLISHLSIHDPYDVGKFEAVVLSLLEKLFEKKDVVILCGGSGLFIKAITEGLDALPPTDPEVRKQLKVDLEVKGINYLQALLKEKDPVYYDSADIQNPHRLMRALEVCISTGQPFSSFRKNKPIERNFKSIKICLQKERVALYSDINKRVEDMFARGLEEEAKQLYPYRHLSALQTVGYSELFDYFDNTISLEKAKDLIKQHSRNYAKRQITWFKKDQEFIWVKAEEFEEIIRLIGEIRSKK